jgi:hypothetical protein
VCRLTVIRHAQAGRISEDRKGRVFLSELIKALEQPRRRIPGQRVKAGARVTFRARAYRPMEIDGKITTAFRATITSKRFINEWPRVKETWQEKFGVTSRVKLRQTKTARAVKFAGELWSESVVKRPFYPWKSPQP